MSRSQYGLRIGQALVFGAAGVTMAVVARADISGAVDSLVWGALVFGGVMAVLVWLLALIFWAFAQGRPPKPPRDAGQSRLDKLLAHSSRFRLSLC
jgi:hypothetical protein